MTFLSKMCENKVATVCKCNNFSFTPILREFNFGDCGVPKSAKLTVSEPFNYFF